MERYKEHIEQIVQPLHGDERKKNDLRRELWQHFLELAEEERKRTDDPDDAIENALQRLGTPQDIQSAFEQPRSKFEDWLIKIDRNIRKRPTESLVHYALRFAAYSIPVVQLLPLVMLAGISYFSTGVNRETYVMFVVLWASLTGWLCIWMFAILLRLGETERLAHGFFMGARSGRALLRRFSLDAGIGLISAIGLLVAGRTVLARLIPAHSETFAYIYIAPWLFAFIWTVFVAILPLMLLRSAQHEQPIRDWPYEEH